jgi:RNA polymerase sigma-70 factor (ECF subfamily)
MDAQLLSAIRFEDAERPLCADAREEAIQVARAKTGDEAAIGWLIAQHRRRVVRLAAHILRRPDDAEDVAQEAFVRAFRNLHAFRGQGRFYTWLYQIVVRLCLDKQRLARWDKEIPLEAAKETTEVYLSVPLEDVRTRLLVETLLDQLSPPLRAMILLRELEGLEYEEIAQVLQIPVGRVRWRLHEARAQFREIWQNAMQEAEHV